MRAVVKVTLADEVLFVAPSEHANYAEQFTHVVLPLDPAQIDDAAVEAMAKAAYNTEVGPVVVSWESTSEMERSIYRAEARAALSALLAHCAEVE